MVDKTLAPLGRVRLAGRALAGEENEGQGWKPSRLLSRASMHAMVDEFLAAPVEVVTQAIEGLRNISRGPIGGGWSAKCDDPL